MRLRVAVFGALGTAATLLAAALLVAPDALLGIEPVAAIAAAAEDGNPRHLLLAGSVLVGLYLTWAARTASRTTPGGPEPDAFDDATADPPEAVTARRARLTAEELDERVAEAVAGDEGARDDVRARMREVAVAAYARAEDRDRAAARAAVERGEWTDDRTAAAFLAADGEVTQSIWARLRLWLDPETERERRLRRTVRAATELEGGR